MAFEYTPSGLTLFDAHAHYNDHAFDGEREDILPALLSGDLVGIVNAGTNPETNLEVIALAERYPRCYAVVGIHPEDIDQSADIDAAMSTLERQLNHPKVLAIGEIGLDYHWDEPPRDVQKQWFVYQLELARKTGSRVVIHDRDAHGDVFDILSQFPQVVGVMHSYSGSAEMARQLAARGWYFSFSGVITFKNAARLAEVVPTIPLDRMLLETDCPYLAPVPFRGKRNHSGLMEYTARRAAELYGIPADELCRRVVENTRRFYRLDSIGAKA